MSPDTPSAARIWRGLRVAALPLLLRAPAGSAPNAAAEPPEPEPRQAWQLAFDEGTREGREEGLRSGFDEGLRRGLAEAEDRLQQATQQARAEAKAHADAQCAQLAALVGALEASRQDWLAAAEDDVVALCYEALCRIVGAEALRPEVVEAQVRHLVSQPRALAPIAVHVHPDDAAHLQQVQGPSGSGAAQTQWVADPEVALGGCIVRGSTGGLDLRLETALEACKAALLRGRFERAQRRAP